MSDKQIHSLSVDFSKVDPIKTDIKLKQFEFGSDSFHISLYDEGKLYEIPGGKVLVCIRIHRPDGRMDEKILYDTRLSDNQITEFYVKSSDGDNITASYVIVNPYPFCTFCSGDIKCELIIRVFNDVGDITVNRISQPFVYQIFKSISSYNMIEKESLDIITALIDAVTGLQATVTYDEYVNMLEGAVSDIQKIFDAKVEYITSDADNSTYPSTKAVYDFVTLIKNSIIANSPDNLNTLKKLASALGGNDHFAEDVFADIAGLRSTLEGADVDIKDHKNNFKNPHRLTKGDLGLGNVDNTSDEDKPLSKAAMEALSLKLDKTEADDLLSGKVDKSSIVHRAYDVNPSEWKKFIPSLSALGDYVEFGRFVQSIDQMDTFNRYDTFPSVEVMVDYVKSQLHPQPATSVTGVLSPNKEYHLGAIDSLTLKFPTNADTGDVIYVTFQSSLTPTNLIIDMSNTYLTEIIPEANTGYEIYAKFMDEYWLVNYSEYDPLIMVEDPDDYF